MAWKATGQPTVRKQRDKWVVRVDGIDTDTGQHRPKQLGTYTSQRSATRAARLVKAEDGATERGTVSWLVRRYVAGRTDITLKSQEQYEWAIPHIEDGLGAIQLARSTATTSPTWIDEPRRRRQAVASGRADLPQRPARGAQRSSRRRTDHPQPRRHASGCRAPWRSRSRSRRAGRGTTTRSTASSRRPRTHRWAIGFRLGVLYGLRRSEILALRWDDLDVEANTLRIDESLVATRTGAAWSNAKNERSRRTIPLDDETMREFARRRATPGQGPPQGRRRLGRRGSRHHDQDRSARAPALATTGTSSASSNGPNCPD